MNTAPREKATPGREDDESQMTSRPQPSKHRLGNLDPEGALKGPLVTQVTTWQGHRVLDSCQPEGLEQILLPLRELEHRAWAFLGS